MASVSAVGELTINLKAEQLREAIEKMCVSMQATHNSFQQLADAMAHMQDVAVNGANARRALRASVEPEPKPRRAIAFGPIK